MKIIFIIISGFLYESIFLFLLYQSWIHGNKIISLIMVLVCIVILVGYVKSLKTDIK